MSTLPSGAGTISSVITGTGSLTKNGTGLLSLSGANYTGGTFVTGGYLNAGSTLTGNVTLNGGGMLSGGNSTFGNNIIFGASGGEIRTYGGSNNKPATYTGAISGSGKLSVTDGGGVILMNTSGFSGPIEAFATYGTGGILKIGGSTTLNGGDYTNTINLANTTKLEYASSSSQTLGGIISGVGGLIKSGSSTLTLTATNAYTGTTTVSAGSLYVNGALGNTTTTVNSGATLGGKGTIGGVTTVNGTIDPGKSANLIGTLTFTKNLTLNGTATFNLDSSATATDKIIATTAALFFGGVLNVTDIAGASAFAQGQSYDLFDFAAASSSGTFSQVNLPALPAGLFWDSSQLYISGVISVVPEPSAALLGGLGALLLLRRRRA